MIIGCIGSDATINAVAEAFTASGHTATILTGKLAGATAVPSGIRGASTLASLCQGADVVVSSMDDDNALVQVVQATDGLASCLAPGRTHVTLGLHAPGTIARVLAAHTSSGQHFVAAPLLFSTHTSAGATAVVAGPIAVVDALAPIFRAIGASVFPAGETPEDAATLALAHAALTGCAVQAMAEAFALVRKYGVDPHVMNEVITDGLFGGSDVHKKYGTAMIDGPSDSTSLTVVNALRALNLVAVAADLTRVPLPSLDACRDRLLGAIAHGDGEHDWTVINREQARASGLD
jgi:3-hydroxyisobutyrate dehydrogenase-like beta-hydroxyacid dehydrogenase